jgi:hypothetical protein
VNVQRNGWSGESSPVEVMEGAGEGWTALSAEADPENAPRGKGVPDAAKPSPEPPRRSNERRIPEGDIFVVGRRVKTAGGFKPPGHLPRSKRPLETGDPAPAAMWDAPAGRRQVLLLLLAALIFGNGLVLGSRRGPVHVIEAPPPSSERSVIT